MIDYQAAIAKVKARLRITDDTNSEIVILESETIEFELGWVFFFQTRAYVETGDISYALGGNAPIIINKHSGELVITGTGYATEQYVEDYTYWEKRQLFIKGRILWKAHQYELPTDCSCLYADLSDERKHYLSANIVPDRSGKPVLFFTRPTGEWTLLCTQQLIGYDTNKIYSLAMKDVEQVPSPKKSLTSKSKIEWDELTVIDKQKVSYTFYTIGGSDFFAFWNIFLMVRHLNKLTPTLITRV